MKGLREGEVVLFYYINSGSMENKGEGRGRGRGFGDRGRGGPRGPPRGGDRRGGPKEEWQPVTKLGRLVKAGYIKTFEEIYTYSLPIKGRFITEL